MREAAAVSPFAAANRQEQQAQWLLWQMHSVEAVSAEDVHTQAAHPAQMAEAAQAQSAIQHRRYDAVVQRMQHAKQKTGAYTSWS